MSSAALKEGSTVVEPTLRLWLEAQAQALDNGDCDPEAVVHKLAAAGVLKVGVAPGQGDITDAVEAVASVAYHSLAAAFVLWGQRAFIEYLLQSPNDALRERLLSDLLSGRLAGATGLSNAMKYLSGIESLQLQAQATSNGWQLDGQLHWVTNLRKSGYVVAAAVARPHDAPPFIVALPGELAGLQRSNDLQLMGLQSSNTAALTLNGVRVGREWLLHDDARVFLPTVRPAFLGLQCGLSIGLARRALAQARQHLHGAGGVLEPVLGQQVKALDDLVASLKQGLLDGQFLQQPGELFRLRIGLAESVSSAVQLELQASGGKAFLSHHGEAFARRWRESAFIPIVTPSLVQLRAELARQGPAQ